MAFQVHISLFYPSVVVPPSTGYNGSPTVTLHCLLRTVEYICPLFSSQKQTIFAFSSCVCACLYFWACSDEKRFYDIASSLFVFYFLDKWVFYETAWRRSTCYVSLLSFVSQARSWSVKWEPVLVENSFPLVQFLVAYWFRISVRLALVLQSANFS